MYNDFIFYGFAFFIGVQLFYSVYFFLTLALYKDDYASGEHKAVSIIVCAHNELENLKKLIPALLTQNYHHFEIVIVDDRSSDGTEDFLKEILKKYSLRVRVVTIEDTPPKMDPKKYALTLGIKAAAHEYLLFTDADCRPFNDKWLLQMQSKFGTDTSIVLGLSQYQSAPGFLNNFIRFDTFYTSVQYLAFALRGQPYMGVGRNMGYTKQVFFDNKGFHPFMDITGGDDDLFINKVATATNTRIALMVESQTISVPKTTFKEWFVQKTRHLSVGKYYKSPFKFLLGMLSASHFFMFLFMILSLISGAYAIFVVVGFLIRLLLNLIIFRLIIKKLRYNLNLWIIPVIDILYPLYYILVGFNALRTKRIRWK